MGRAVYLMTDNSRELSKMFKVLSVDKRVRILRLLIGGSLCVNALASRLDITPAAVSQHLRILRDAGLVTDEKQGYYVHYRLNREEFARWKELFTGFMSSGEEVDS